MKPRARSIDQGGQAIAILLLTSLQPRKLKATLKQRTANMIVTRNPEVVPAMPADFPTPYQRGINIEVMQIGIEGHGTQVSTETAAMFSRRLIAQPLQQIALLPRTRIKVVQV
jgi:hypothetical protein